MNSLFVDIGRIWLDWRGRGKPTPQYIFQENEIVSPAYPRKVSSFWQATYLNLHPTHFAFAVAPNGATVNLAGGYNPLPPGHYNIYYIDRQNRINHLPRVVETTADGCQVGIVLAITYRIRDPLLALQMQNAVATLLQFIQSDMREFIRSNAYDDLIADQNGRKVGNAVVARYIRLRHDARRDMSDLFFVADVVVQEIIGDPRVTEQRQRNQMSQRQIAAQKVLQDLNQELNEKVARQNAEIQQIRVASELSLQKSKQEIERQNFELEKIKAEFQNQQDAMKRALEALAQAFSSPAFLRDPQVANTIWKIFNTMGISQPQPQETATAQGGLPAQESPGIPSVKELDTLTDTLLNLMGRK